MPIAGTAINPNRAVAVLTPLVFAPLAGAITAGVAKYGVDIDGAQLQAIFIAGSTIALAKAALWTKGWQAFEQRQDAQVAGALGLSSDDDALAAQFDGDDELDAELGEDEPPALAAGDLGESGDDLFGDDEPEALGDDGFDEDDDDLADDDMDDLDAEAAELLTAKGS